VCKKVQQISPFTTQNKLHMIRFTNTKEPSPMKFIPHDTRKLLEKTIASSEIIRLEDGAKHAKVRHLATGDWIPVAGSPSDHRTMKNFEAALRRLVSYGHGFVYARTGHLPVVAM
jgi:hypothetical protein